MDLTFVEQTIVVGLYKRNYVTYTGKQIMLGKT
jgi:hypothetical protein